MGGTTPVGGATPVGEATLVGGATQLGGASFHFFAKPIRCQPFPKTSVNIKRKFSINISFQIRKKFYILILSTVLLYIFPIAET